jgi:hypothetical protein
MYAGDSMSLDNIIVITLLLIAVAALIGVRLNASHKEQEKNKETSKGEK